MVTRTATNTTGQDVRRREQYHRSGGSLWRAVGEREIPQTRYLGLTKARRQDVPAAVAINGAHSDARLREVTHGNTRVSRFKTPGTAPS